MLNIKETIHKAPRNFLTHSLSSPQMLQVME